MFLALLVDLDHLLAEPMFDSEMNSINFHLFHKYYFIFIYIIMCFFLYEKYGLSWKWKAVGVGLCLHMIRDWQDFVLWK